MSTLLPSEILKTDTTLRILPFLPGNSSDGPRPTIFTNSAWSLPLHLLCEAMLPGIWNSCGFGSFWKHLDGFNAWKIANWGSSFLRGVEKKNSNHQLFAFGGKYQGIACKECNEVFTLFHFCRTLAEFMCFTSVHQPSNSMQFYTTNRSQCWREALWETMGFSSPLAATLHQLDTVWALLKIFEDICMFKFVELHCLMLFMFVHLAGTVESSSNNPIPNCEAEGLLHLLLVAAQTGVDDRPAR